MLQRNYLGEHEFMLPPNQTVAYGFDWRKWLVDENILTSEFVVTGGIGSYGGAILYNQQQTAIYVNGGIAGKFYTITNTITTQTRTGVETITLSCHFTGLVLQTAVVNTISVTGFGIKPAVMPLPQPAPLGAAPAPAPAPTPI